MFSFKKAKHILSTEELLHMLGRRCIPQLFCPTVVINSWAQLALLDKSHRDSEQDKIADPNITKWNILWQSFFSIFIKNLKTQKDNAVVAMGELDSSSTNSQDVDLDEELQPVQLNTQAIAYLSINEEKIHKTYLTY